MKSTFTIPKTTLEVIKVMRKNISIFFCLGILNIPVTNPIRIKRVAFPADGSMKTRKLRNRTRIIRSKILRLFLRLSFRKESIVLFFLKTYLLNTLLNILAIVRITVILVNSDTCNWNTPKSIHLLTPFTSFPNSKTSIKSKILSM